jgi:hypothetical protein
MNVDVRARGTVFLAVLAGICVSGSWLMYLVEWFLAGIGAGINATFVSISVAALYWTWGAPIIAPLAALGALYLWRSTRFPYFAIIPALLLVASAVLSMQFFWLSLPPPFSLV